MRLRFTAWTRRKFDPGLLLVLVLTLFLIIPLARNPGLPDGYDVRIHSYRAAEMLRSWETGLYFPSWAEGMYFGYGSPVFHFYARLTYLLTALTQSVTGIATLEALRWLLVACLFTCSGGMYLFCKRRGGRIGAVAAGLLYVYSPYLMYVESYNRGAFPELLAFALFALLLWRLDALRDKPSPLNFLLACTLQAALINSHNLMAAVLTGIAFAWVAFETCVQWFNREASRMDASDGLLAALAMLLGVGGSASFWLPILLESDSVQLRNLLDSFLIGARLEYVRAEVLLSPPPLADLGAINGLYAKRSLGVAQWTLAAAGGISSLLLYVSGYRTRHPQAFLGAAFFATLAGLLIALTLPTASSVWGAVQPLRFLQFPWRLLGPVAACLAIVAGMNGLWLARLDARVQISAVALFAALPIVTSIPLLTVPDWTLPTLDTSLRAFHAEELAGRGMGTTATHEFLPSDTETWPWASWELMADYWDGYPIDKLNRESLPAGAEAQWLHNAPESLAWRVETDEAFVAEIHNLYWLGWRAELNGEEASIEPSAPNGFITVAVPPGEFTLRVYLGGTRARDASMLISALAIALACVVAWRLRKREIAARPYNEAARLTRREATGLLLGGMIALLTLLVTFREGVAWLNSRPGEALPAQVQRKFTLDGVLQLIGYDISGDRLRAGDTLYVSAYWHAREDIDINYSSFLHLSRGGHIHAQIDRLHPGNLATGEHWGPAGYVLDSYALEIPADLPAGDYELIVGLYTCELRPPGSCGSGYRPTARDESGNVIGNSITLAAIRVDAR